MEQQIVTGTEHFVSQEERTHLLHFCLKMVGNRDVAEDLVQETLFEAWKHVHTLRDSSRRIQWLFGVARNVCLRWLRTSHNDMSHRIDTSIHKDMQPVELEELLTDDFDISLELERKELIELLDRAMALLPPETRTVLVKRYVEESSLHEVAAELAPYVLQHSGEQWEETPFWCHVCGMHRLLGVRKPEKGHLLLKCPGCNAGVGEVQSYNDLPLLRGVKSYKTLVTSLRNWCASYYWTGLRAGSVLCEECGRVLPVGICTTDDLPNWVRSHDERTKWTCHNTHRFVTILCESCHASYRTVLEYLVLGLPEGRQFLQAHPRIRTLPNQEVDVNGRRALITRHESITDNATLTVVSDYEMYNILHID